MHYVIQNRNCDSRQRSKGNLAAHHHQGEPLEDRVKDNDKTPHHYRCSGKEHRTEADRADVSSGGH